MSDGDILKAAVEEYGLDVNGVHFWTPYWINLDMPPFFKGAPLAGKGTPAEIKEVLSQKISESGEQPTDADGYLKLMRKLGLGVDCSALAYHMLDKLLTIKQMDLAQHIFVPKADVIEASQKPSWQEAGVAAEQLEALADPAPVRQVADLFHKDPRHMTNVARLTTVEAANTVLTADARPGDMIRMTGETSDHIGIIVEVSPGLIRYADSSREWGEYGGVRYCDIKVTDPSQGLEAQDWTDMRFYHPEKGDRICRLKVLDGRD